MTTELTLSDITVTIPALGDSANIVTAFTDYHTDMAAAVAVLSRATNTFTGDIAINGGDATTTATTFNLINTNATTVNFAGAGTGITIGASGSGTTTLRNTTVAMAGAATVGTTLAVTGNTTLTGDLAVNGGDLTTSASTFNLLASPTTVNIAAAGTAVNIGASTGQTAILNNLVLAAAKTLIFEGATNDNFETTLTVTDPTADRTITLPNNSGNVVLDTATQTLTSKTLTSPVISTIVNTGTLTLPTSTDTLVGRATTDTLTNKTITLAGSAGTTAPLTITSGTNLTTPVAGAIEYDGKAFYGTPSSVSTNRGLIPTPHYYTWYGGDTSINPLATNSGYPVFSMAANTAYEVECVYFMVLNTGLVSTSIIAVWTGTAAPITNYYEISSGFATSSFAGTTAAQNTSYQTQSASTTISATASTARYGVIKVKAIVRVATAGTIGFAVYGSSSSATITMYPGSYIKATPLGSNSVSTIGTWT